MPSARRSLIAAVIAGVALSACGSTAATVDAAAPASTASPSTAAPSTAMADHSSTTAAMADHSSTTAMADHSSTTAMADHSSTTAMAAGAMAAWSTLKLTDTAGASFNLEDFAGKPVFVQTFATTCAACAQQLADTDKAAAAGGPKDVFLALSTETGLSAKALADYAASHNLTHLRLAVMTPQMVAAVIDGFGAGAVNPSSTAHFVLDAMGHAGPLSTGAESMEMIHSAMTQAMGG